MCSVHNICNNLHLSHNIYLKIPCKLWHNGVKLINNFIYKNKSLVNHMSWSHASLFDILMTCKSIWYLDHMQVYLISWSHASLFDILITCKSIWYLDLMKVYFISWSHIYKSIWYLDHIYTSLFDILITC